MDISELDKKELQLAKNLLENPGLAAKITNFFGASIEKGFQLLPSSWNDNVAEITQTALTKAVDAAIFTMKNTPREQSSDRWHKAGVAVSGGVGGFFGVSAIAVELPVSTTIMLRSIADIARSEGESISAIETKLACLEVLALGGESKSDDGVKTGYFAVRAALAKSVTEAAQFIAQKGVAEEAAPVIVKLIANIAKRFGIQVTQKIAAQAVPAIGAAGGVIINTLFIDHFQDMARGHFIVRKLERLYDVETIRKTYDTLPSLG